MKYSILISISIFFFTSCTKEELFSDKTENHFFLENNEAIMPVQVKGNTNSKVFVIILHGGPGDSAINGFGDSGVFKDLESDYAIVYYDQRCAGLSQGNCDPKNLKVSDYLDDLDKLILTLEHIYGDEISLFLLGHSWGATLGLDYLINAEFKSKIKGFIQSDGSHNIPMLSIEQKAILIFYANQQIGLGNNIDQWQNILDDIEGADPTVKEDRGRILSHTYQTEELFLSVDSTTNSVLAIPLGNLINGLIPTVISEALNNDFVSDLFEYDISNELNEITTPTALYWGKFDLVHPPNMVLDIYEKLGSSEKELFFFEKSFHTPMANQNEEYQNKVKAFIELYR